MNKKFNMKDINIMGAVWKTAGFLITVIRGLLIIGGGAIASSLADVILGALTLDLLFVNTAGAIDAIKYAPMVISMGASGIQLILWQMIQKKGGITKVFKSKDWVWILVFGGVILMKFADDFMDIGIVNYLMVGSTLPVALGIGFFNVLKVAVLFITWILTGFSEIFVVNAIEVMKEQDSPKNQGNQPKQNNPDNRPPRIPQGHNRPDRHAKPNKSHADGRPPTYHPVSAQPKTPPFYFDEQTYHELEKKTDES